VHPPDSDRQQAAVAAIADDDAFNWGYDPVHYGTPEGSYSTQPDGPLRVLEYREMVQVGGAGVGCAVKLQVHSPDACTKGIKFGRWKVGAERVLQVLLLGETRRTSG
jgi:hypothetical protein